MKWLLYTICICLLQSCASVSYVKKHQLIAPIKKLTKEIYAINNGEELLKEKQLMVFTKNGRVKFSITFNMDNDLIETTEKKLWFIKKSFPNKDAYYCKTRWKPGQRERISCYTQKKHKQNEVIYHYNKNGSIHKIVDNFTNFYTQFYYYDSFNQLSKIVIKDQNNTIIDEILLLCISKDNKGNCIDLKKEYIKTNKTQKIRYKFTY